MDQNADQYPEGTVIRWLVDGRYHYAAIKAGSSWYTTSVSRGGQVRSSVPQVVAWPALLQVLERAEASDVEVASEWGSVLPDPMDLI